MSSVSSDGDAGGAAAADDRAFSPHLADGKREQLDAAAASPQTSKRTAAAMAAKDTQQVKGGASSAAEPTAGERDAVADVGKSMLEEISALKQKQKEARDAKNVVQRQLRNAERRRSRLKKRARLLSDGDLLAVVSMRNHERTMGQRDSAPDQGDDEDAELLLGHPEAGSSRDATPKASTAS